MNRETRLFILGIILVAIGTFDVVAYTEKIITGDDFPIWLSVLFIIAGLYSVAWGAKNIKETT